MAVDHRTRLHLQHLVMDLASHPGLGCQGQAFTAMNISRHGAVEDNIATATFSSIVPDSLAHNAEDLSV